MASLPDDFTVRPTTDRWVVIGPTGLFLVRCTEDDPHPVAEQTAIDAHVLRNRLAGVLDLVPWVEPVVVTSRPAPGRCTCAVVEPGMFRGFVANGPPVIPEAELQLLRHHVPAVLTEMETLGGFS